MGEEINPVLPLVKEVLEIKDANEVSSLLQNGWICIGLQPNQDLKHLFILGRVI
jgi:hypothetical protein